MSKVKLIVIGLGNISKRHLKDLSNVAEAEIVALADPSLDALERTRQQYPHLADVPHYSDYKQALAEVKADGALILTPHFLHYEQGIACLDAGLHVLMEKPFVHGVESCERIIAHAKAQGKHLAIAYQRHLMGPFLYIREFIRSGGLGDIRYVNAYQTQAWLEGTRGTWRQDPEASCGGQLNDSGSHLLDAVLWVTGLKPTEVSARIDKRGTGVDIDSAITVRFAGGALGTFNVVGSAAGGGMHEDISINGSKGSVLYRSGTLQVLREGEKRPSAVAPEQLPPSGNPDRNFVDLILGRVDEPAAPAECGLQINVLTEAAWKSDRQGGEVIRLG
ncbi:MAG: putative dehydrogenase [Paenibacillaceae bacterium]|jgi:predicted dehydrogenase|nr:putative dehydrogenase [Paenibacillaceae bacterium]